MVNDNIVWHKSCNEDEFETIFALYYAPLCAYANKIVCQKQVSEELVQDLFLHLWEKKDELSIQNVKSYLYRSIYHKALHYIAHKGVKSKYYQSQNIDQDAYPSPEDAMLTEEIYRIYQDELSCFPAKTRNIFKMSRYSEMTHKEIAQKLNISIKTVEAHISKALKAFRTRLSQY